LPSVTTSAPASSSGIGDVGSAGGTLAVDDDEIGPIAAPRVRQRIDDRVAARAAYRVAEEHESHVAMIALGSGRAEICLDCVGIGNLLHLT
jgi:hypothetical protein